MFNTQKDTIYYLRNYFTNEDLKIGNFDDLIQFLVKGCRFSIWSNNKIYNKYFEELNCTTNDYSHEIHKQAIKTEDNYNYIETYTIKQFLFYDNDYRIIDIRDFKSIVFKKFKEKSINTKNNKEQDYIPGETYIRKNWYGKNYYKFRRGPVPGIHKRKYGSYYKHPKIKQKLTFASIPEYKEYIKPKEYETRNYWCDDYGPKYTSKSWKDNKKIKHQWQKK